MKKDQNWRKTSQRTPSAVADSRQTSRYDLYPAAPIGPGMIRRGYDDLAQALADQTNLVLLDGYCGVLWDHLRIALTNAFTALGLDVHWIDIGECLLPEPEILELTAPFSGGDDPLFGRRCALSLSAFFNRESIVDLGHETQPRRGAPLQIIYGCGAGLVNSGEALLVYVDVPKDEIQFRQRAASISNLGIALPTSPKTMYKRSYFVDWPVLNDHKRALLPRVAIFVDGQRPDDPTFIVGDELVQSLKKLAQSFFRVRPWFEPGPWGGHWIEENVEGLPTDVPNYAWSFELIAPENGLTFESDGLLLEVSFDCLMFIAGDDVLGDWSKVFGVEFPIRFDWLDTMGGGNLSVQCHPRPNYIRDHFGERFTQDETYYILECGPDAEVYLGFVEDINAADFRIELERSVREATPIIIDKFVAKHPAQKHDLFLIPGGAVHCSGRDNIVLEISATPYIFTFKMYDWMRLDLEGKPRTLNIDRAFHNLDFNLKGAEVVSTLISEPVCIEEGSDWRVMHLPTHRNHFYDIHRLEFEADLEQTTAGSPHVLAIVQGGPVRVELTSGLSRTFQYAETFVIPAGAKSYRLVNLGPNRCFVVKAFIRSTPL